MVLTLAARWRALDKTAHLLSTAERLTTSAEGEKCDILDFKQRIQTRFNKLNDRCYFFFFSKFDLLHLTRRVSSHIQASKTAELANVMSHFLG